MQEPDKQIKRKHWKNERQVKWSWQSNTRGKACDTGHENNNGISSANTYFSPPNHTYEELERSISAYKKDMQCKFKAVLKTAVFANSLHQQCRSSCWFFPSHATNYKDGTFVWGGWGSIFPPTSSKLQVSLLLGYNISSQMSLGKGFFSLLPIRPLPGDLHFVLWNSSHFYSSACTVIYFCPYNSLILVSIESAS